MSQAELNALERDVEQARARFADDLARLRSPRLKEDLWAEARDTKNEVIERTKEAAKDGMQNIVTDLKERAAANPVAALAIGAGLAWRLYRHPPIASLLIGCGVVSLLRTPSGAGRSAQPYMGLHDEDPPATRLGRDSIASRTSGLATAAKDKIEHWSERAGDTATQMADRAAAVAGRAGTAARETAMEVAEKATSVADRASTAARETVSQLKEKASSAADRTAEAARETMSQLKDKASSAVERASHALHDNMPDAEARDRLLVGAAALAVATAVGIAYQRSREDA